MWLLIKIIYHIHMIKFKGAIAKLEEAAARAHGRPARLDRLRSACRHLRGVYSHLTRMHDFLESDLPGDDRLGIWGRRGAGKTSLLTPLRQPSPYHALFDRVFYLDVGSGWSVTDVQLGICCTCMGCSYGVMSRPSTWRRSACRLPTPLGKGRRRQKVVVATRSPDVGALMGCTADNVVEVRCMGEDDAWGLFRDCVGDKILQDSRIWSLAKEMAQACGGLPEALTRFGWPMSAIEHVDEWRYMHKYLKARLPLSQEQLLDLLVDIRHW
ncbi:hypothetical protein VPH35_106077 [Triticum aestivum]